MTDYKVGSIGNLISTNSLNTVGPTIVYKDVSIKPVQNRGARKGSNLDSSQKRVLDPAISTPVNDKIKKRKLDVTDKNADGTEPADDDLFHQNAKRRVHIKNNTRKHVDDPERESRTVYVGNIPYAQAKKKKITKFFSNYGEVESIRFRCAPLKDPRMPKKVAVIRHEFHPDRSSISAYVVFRSQESAQSSLKANGILFHDHHLLIDLASNAANKKLQDPKKSVFIGNLPFAAEEEELWKFFADCGTIESVRIVRDRLTAVSKGVAFVNFESADAAELALQLDKTRFRNRDIAVTRVRSSAKPSIVKSPYEKVVRHKSVDETTRIKKSKKEEVRLFKKEKRMLRKERENALGIQKKKDGNNSAGEMEQATKDIEQNEGSLEKPNSKYMGAGTEEIIEESKKHINNGVKSGKTKSKDLKFQGQTIEDAKNKKKKKNKGLLKKKKTAAVLLGDGLPKKKKKSAKVK